MNTITNILQVPHHKIYTIVRYNNGFVACKLMSMGLLPGNQISIIRKSIFGNTYYLRTNNNCIALRKNEAESIIIDANNCVN